MHFHDDYCGSRRTRVREGAKRDLAPSRLQRRGYGFPSTCSDQTTQEMSVNSNTSQRGKSFITMTDFARTVSQCSIADASVNGV